MRVVISSTQTFATMLTVIDKKYNNLSDKTGEPGREKWLFNTDLAENYLLRYKPVSFQH